MGIFAENAEKLWAAGLPVIPLWPRAKNPAVMDWATYCQRTPSDEEKQTWLQVHSGGNIGLPLGPSSGFVAFDVDTPDVALIELIESLIPVSSPWRRVGKKGFVSLFKYQGEKTFQIKDVEGKVICELLSMGRQVVVPPSVHPETGLAYTENVALIEACGNGKWVPALPLDFEKALRASLEVKGVQLSVSGFSRLTEWSPRSSRDTKYTSVCGMYARDVLTGRVSLLEAVGAVEAWPATFTEQVDGDNLNGKDGVAKLIRFLIRGVREQDFVLRTGWDKGLTEEDKAALGLDFGVEEQEMPFEFIIDSMKADLAVADSLEAGKIAGAKMKVVEDTLDRLRRSPSLSNVHQEGILKAIIHESGLRITMGTLRKELSKLRNQGLAGESHAEIAEHMRDCEEIQGILWEKSKFWEWDGACWNEKDNHELQSFVVGRYGNLPVCKRDADYKAVVKTFQTLVTGKLAEIDVAGVNFANGFLGPDGRLVEHRKEYGCTYVLPYRYVGEEGLRAAGWSGGGGVWPGGKFGQFLADAWGSDEDRVEKVMALREALCATMFGLAPKMARAVLLYGVAHSGKSVLLKIVEALMPSGRVAAISPEMWGDKFAPASLAGALLNIGGELHESKKIDGSVFKTVVVGETMSAQFKNQPLFTFAPICAHWFASNHLPNSDDMSEGFLRRWLVLSFEKKFPEDRRNVSLAEEIVAEERELIVAWAVGAMRGLLEKPSYTLPGSHEKRIRELMASQDSVYFFLQAGQRTKVIPSLGTVGTDGVSKLSVTPVQSVFIEYQTFISMTGARPASFPRFLNRMRGLGPMLGFQEVTQTLENGCQEVGYTGLIVTGAGGGKVKGRA
jgi:P4 family phage/plasmid primase-like protien